MARLDRREKYRRLMADVGHRNASVAHNGPAFTESCICDGKHARTLYGQALVAIPADDSPDTEGKTCGPCPNVCGYLKAAREALEKNGRSVDYKKLRKIMGTKLEGRGVDRVEIVEGTTVNARLANTLLRFLDTKRARVASLKTLYGLDTPDLVVAADDGSWAVYVRGMHMGPYDTDPVRKVPMTDLAGRRQSRRRR